MNEVLVRYEVETHRFAVCHRSRSVSDNLV